MRAEMPAVWLHLTADRLSELARCRVVRRRALHGGVHRFPGDVAVTLTRPPARAQSPRTWIASATRVYGR